MVTLRKITLDNVGKIFLLKADEDLVATNPWSLAQAFAYVCENGTDKLLVRGIYFEETPVGFMMVDLDAKDDCIDNNGERYFHLWRLMVDEKFQDKGYGRAAMEILIEELKSRIHGDARALYTSTVPLSTVTPKFYGSFGFVVTGEMDEDEAVMRLAL